MSAPDCPTPLEVAYPIAHEDSPVLVMDCARDQHYTKLFGRWTNGAAFETRGEAAGWAQLQLSLNPY